MNFLDHISTVIAPDGFVWDATHADLVRGLAREFGSTEAGAWVRDEGGTFEVVYWCDGMPQVRLLQVLATDMGHDELLKAIRRGFRESIRRSLGVKRERRFKSRKK